MSKNYFDRPLVVAKYLNNDWKDGDRFLVMEELLMENHEKARGLVFNMPMKVGKTSFAEAAMTWHLAQEKGNILYISHNSDDAENVVSHLNSYLNSMGYRMPDAVNVSSAGVLSNTDLIRGKYSLIVVDDPIKNASIATDLDYLDKQWDWIQDIVAAHLTKDGTFMLLMHRWCRDDMTGRITDPASKSKSVFKNMQVKHVSFQLVAEYDIKVGNRTYIKKGDTMVGHADSQDVKALLERLKTDLGMDIYNRFYQQKVV